MEVLYLFNGSNPVIKCLLIINKLQMTEESIYNIIPKEYQPPAKEKIYKSKYPSNIPPTGSTFCHHTTSKLPVVTFSNLESQPLWRF